MDDLVGTWVTCKVIVDDIPFPVLSGKGLLARGYTDGTYTIQAKNDEQVARMIFRFREGDVQVTRHKQYTEIVLEGNYSCPDLQETSR